MLFYQSATVPGRWKAGKTKSRRVACQEELQVLLVERKVAGSNLEEDVASFLSLFCVKVDLFVICHVPIIACWYSKIIVMWQLAIDGDYCNFTSEI